MKDAEKVSSEDRRFLQIGEEKTTKDGEHYVVPLRFWNNSLETRRQNTSYEEIDVFEG